MPTLKDGSLDMQKDSVVRTLIVAVVLCVACSVLVSASAVLLKPQQEMNKKLDIKKNLLLASGLIEPGSYTPEEILAAYEQVSAEVIDLATGEVQAEMDAESFDQKKARKTSGKNKKIDSALDTAGIKMRSKYSIVYKVMDGESVKMLILPINGKGLWSTLYGFIALAADTKTIQGIGFYQHGETPGLGGEVDNPRWKAQWKGKMAFDDNFQAKIHLIKGLVNSSDADAAYKVDGLSGATITSNGVTGLVQYWLGADGFGPYLAKFRSSFGEVASE